MPKVGRRTAIQQIKKLIKKLNLLKIIYKNCCVKIFRIQNFFYAAFSHTHTYYKDLSLPKNMSDKVLFFLSMLPGRVASWEHLWAIAVACKYSSSAPVGEIMKTLRIQTPKFESPLFITVQGIFIIQRDVVYTLLIYDQSNLDNFQRNFEIQIRSLVEIFLYSHI